MTPVLRPAAQGDEAAWRRLWAGYTDFYNVALPEAVTAATWARILATESALNCTLAEVDGRVLGFAVWHRHLASWSDKDDFYLEDLFVDEGARGLGLGRALIEALIAQARQEGCGRFYWHTNESNTRARALYDSIVPSDGHLRYRLTL
jgi:GNAT superfamily N-acetyltransferase